MPAVGIDFGTANLRVAVRDVDGNFVVVPNKYGNRATPACVAIQDSKRLVGESAKDQSRDNIKTTLHNVKRILGRTYHSVCEDDPPVAGAVQVGCDSNLDAPRFLLRGDASSKQRILTTPEEVSSMMLTYMSTLAQDHLGESFTQVVIAVPPYFTSAQRQAIRDAAHISGLEVLSLVNETSATALAYASRIHEERVAVIIDMGAGGGGVSLVRASEGGQVKVLATSGERLSGGGEDFNSKMMKHFAAMIWEKHKKNLYSEPAAQVILRSAWEEAKMKLSENESVDLEVYLPGIDVVFSAQIDRKKFETTCWDVIFILQSALQEILTDGKVAVGDVDDIVLVGGSSRVPMVRNVVLSFFDGKEPVDWLHKEESVAVGAALLAASLTGVQPFANKTLLEDLMPLQLTMHVFSDKIVWSVEKNHPLPVEDTFLVPSRCTSCQVDQGAGTNVFSTLCFLKVTCKSLLLRPCILIKFSKDGIVTFQPGESVHLEVAFVCSLSSEEVDLLRRRTEPYRCQGMRDDSRTEARRSLEVLCRQLLERKAALDEVSLLSSLLQTTLRWLECNQDCPTDEYKQRSAIIQELASKTSQCSSRESLVVLNGGTSVPSYAQSCEIEEPSKHESDSLPCPESESAEERHKSEPATHGELSAEGGKIGEINSANTDPPNNATQISSPKHERVSRRSQESLDRTRDSSVKAWRSPSVERHKKAMGREDGRSQEPKTPSAKSDRVSRRSEQDVNRTEAWRSPSVERYKKTLASPSEERPSSWRLPSEESTAASARSSRADNVLSWRTESKESLGKSKLQQSSSCKTVMTPKGPKHAAETLLANIEIPTSLRPDPGAAQVVNKCDSGPALVRIEDSSVNCAQKSSMVTQRAAPVASEVREQPPATPAKVELKTEESPAPTECPTNGELSSSKRSEAVSCKAEEYLKEDQTFLDENHNSDPKQILQTHGGNIDVVDGAMNTILAREDRDVNPSMVQAQQSPMFNLLNETTQSPSPVTCPVDTPIQSTDRQLVQAVMGHLQFHVLSPKCACSASELSPRLSLDVSGYSHQDLAVRLLDRQEEVLQCMAEATLRTVMSEVRDAGLVTLLVDTVSTPKSDVVSLMLRYCQMSGEIVERVIALEDAARATGQVLFERVTGIFEKHHIDWTRALLAVGMDAARVTKEAYGDLLSLLKERAPRVRLVWNASHRIEDVISQAWEECVAGREFCGLLKCLREFFCVPRRVSVLTKKCGRDCEALFKAGSLSDIVMFLVENSSSVTDALVTLKEGDSATAFHAKEFLSAIVESEFRTVLAFSHVIFRELQPVSSALTFADSCKTSKVTKKVLNKLLDKMSDQFLESMLTNTETLGLSKFSVEVKNYLSGVLRKLSKATMDVVVPRLSNCRGCMRDIDCLVLSVFSGDFEHYEQRIFSSVSSVNRNELGEELPRAKTSVLKVPDEVSSPREIVRMMLQAHNRRFYKHIYPNIYAGLLELGTMPLLASRGDKSRLELVRHLLQETYANTSLEATIVMHSAADTPRYCQLFDSEDAIQILKAKCDLP